MNDQSIELVDVLSDKYSVGRLRKSGNLNLIFAIISISLSVLIPLVCIATAAVALIPAPVVGFVFMIIFTVLEIIIMLGRMVFSILALVRSIILLVRLSNVNDTIAAKEIRLKAIISIVLCVLSWLLSLAATPIIIFTNVFETVFSAV